ncbi:MAG: thiamine-phosphate kinase [Weeksellaceae bacterium]|nr:thiamine-phosphate kinase [Weeksellaceae bacterium]
MLEEKNRELKQLSDLGEFALIERLTADFTIDTGKTVLGVGDDAAVLTPSQSETIITTDMLCEGVHFNPNYTSLRHLGYKAVAVNVSDICAMNAIPSHILVSIAASARFTVEALDELYAGIKIACDSYKIDLVGGDTVSSRSGLVISVTALGHAQAHGIVKRSGAADKELLVVSGDLGSAYFGLQVLERENISLQSNPQHQPDLEPYDYIIQRQMKPEARLDIVHLLNALDVVPTAMIDVSDGLASEVLHLAKNSGVGFVIYEEKLPMDHQVIDTAEEFGINPVTAVLSGGEDYELLFTIKQEDFEKIKGNPHLTVIGHASSDTSSYLVTKDNQTIELTAMGWDNFDE